MARDLVTVLNDSVYTAINGYDASTDKLMFNNYGNKDTMTRTTDNWMHALQGVTGIPALNNKTQAGYVDGAIFNGALITPRHAIFAQHAFLQPNSVLYFWDRSNVRYTRTVLQSKSTTYSNVYGDYHIVLLDSDLPSSIEPLKVFPPDLYKYFQQSTFSPATRYNNFTGDTLIVSTDQEEKSIVSRMTTLDFGAYQGIEAFDDSPDSYSSNDNSRITYSTPVDSAASVWHEAKVAGDSGSPFMAMVDDELVLLGVASTTSDFDGITNLRTQNDINKLIVDADTAEGISTGYKLTTYNLKGFKQYNISGRDYTNIGQDISNGTLIQFRGSAKDHNNYHYSIPYAASSVVRTDPRDESQTLYNINSISTSNQKWVGAAYASNKRIYAAPHAAYGPLIINTEDPDNVTTSYINVGYGLQTRGIGLLDNGSGSGAAYMASYSGTESTKKFTFDSNGNESAITSLAYTVPTGPYETARGSLVATDKSLYPFIYRSYWGMVNGGNDKMYGIPYGASQVQVIDLNDDSISFIDTDLTGLADYDTTAAANTDYYYLRSPQWNKYKGGVLASNGCIYAHGTHARGVLKIDTSNDTVTEIAYPHTIVMAMTAGYTGADESRSNSWGRQPASMFSVEGPDGKIYNTPWNLPYQLVIDPADDSITFDALSAILDEDTVGADLAWYTDGTTINNEMYLATGEADYILNIGVDGYQQGTWTTVTPFSQASSSSPSPSPSNSVTPSPSQSVTPSPSVSLSQGVPSPSPSVSPSGTPSPSVTSSTSVTPSVSPSSSLVISPSPSSSVTPSVSPSTSPSVTPSISTSVTPSPSTSVTPSPSISVSVTPSGTPGESVTPSPSVTPSSSVTPSVTPSISESGTPTPTPTGTGTPTPTPTVTPTNNNKRCVTLEYDVADGPDRFIVNYKGNVIIDTGFVGNAAYVYGGTKRQVFVNALIKEGLDISGLTLANDGYPVVNSTTEGEKEAIVALFDEKDAYVTIQSPVHDKPGWTYTLNCPAICIPPTPTNTQTPTGTTTPTPTQTRTPQFVAPSNPSPTPTGTATPTPTPTGTPIPSSTPGVSQSQTITPTGTSTPTPSTSPSVTPSSSVTPSVTPSQSVTPSTSPSVTPSVTPSASVTPSISVSPSVTPSVSVSLSPTPSVTASPSGTPSPSLDSPSPSPSVTPSGTPSPSPSQSGSPSPSASPSGTPSPSPSGTPSPSPSVTPSGTPSPSPSSSAPTPCPSASPSSTPPEPCPSASVTPSVSVTPSGTPSPSPSGTPSPSAQPTFSLVSSKFAINEGEGVFITLTTTNVAEGTNVPYTVTGISSDDITQDLTGNFVVGATGTAARIFSAVEDSLTEGNETMVVTLDDHSSVSTQCIIVDTSTDVAPSPTPSSTPAVSPSVTPSVTPSGTPSGTPSPSPSPSSSLPGNPTYSLTSSKTSIDEGSGVLISLITSNVADGTSIPYAVLGISSSDISEDMTGNLTISNNGAAKVFSAVSDNLTEGTETMRFQINGQFGDYIDIPINDTSIDPSPTPSVTPSPTPSVTPSASLTQSPTPS